MERGTSVLSSLDSERFLAACPCKNSLLFFSYGGALRGGVSTPQDEDFMATVAGADHPRRRSQEGGVVKFRTHISRSSCSKKPLTLLRSLRLLREYMYRVSEWIYLHLDALGRYAFRSWYCSVCTGHAQVSFLSLSEEGV